MRINDETRKNARGERAGGGGGGVTRYFAVARLRAPLEREIRRIVGLGSLAAWTEHMLRAGSSASSAGADFNSSSAAVRLLAAAPAAHCAAASPAPGRGGARAA